MNRHERLYLLLAADIISLREHRVISENRSWNVENVREPSPSTFKWDYRARVYTHVMRADIGNAKMHNNYTNVIKKEKERSDKMETESGTRKTPAGRERVIVCEL